MKLNKKYIYIVLFILGAAVTVGILPKIKGQSGEGVGVTNSKPVSADKLESGEIKIPLGSELYIIGIGQYMGAYVEDGSNEFVENVMMILVENSGEKEIQLANITLNQNYLFELTTLLPGEKMIILEKNRLPYTDDMIIESADISNVAFFQESPSMHEELLKIENENNIIHVVNVSDNTFPGGKVFYKNMLEDKLLGGITYTVSIPELKSGEGVAIETGHYEKESSRFKFVTYAE